MEGEGIKIEKDKVDKANKAMVKAELMIISIHLALSVAVKFHTLDLLSILRHQMDILHIVVQEKSFQSMVN